MIECITTLVPPAVQPYHRQSYDPRNIGLAGIQWDSAVLFQLTSCQAKGDYDAFTLQQVSY